MWLQNVAEVWKVEEVDDYGITGLISAWNVSAISLSVRVVTLKVWESCSFECEIVLPMDTWITLQFMNSDEVEHTTTQILFRIGVSSLKLLIETPT